jgi:AcrR family transcriptional regulator
MDKRARDATPRKASREVRRQQLIDATIETLATRGYAQTTMTDVAKTAGVSHGLVNFHFETKEKLLAETLLYLAQDYRENWQEALAAAPHDPAAQLDALIIADFNARICTTPKLLAWCAFWGEAQSRPMYQEKCGANDLAYNTMLEGVVHRVIADGGYPHNAERAARVMRVTVEGVWMDLLTMTNPYSRDEALKTVYLTASALFPKHFSESGLLQAGG